MRHAKKTINWLGFTLILSALFMGCGQTNEIPEEDNDFALTINAVNIDKLSNAISTINAQESTINDLTIQLTEVNQQLDTSEQLAIQESTETPILLTATIGPPPTPTWNPEWKTVEVTVSQIYVYEPSGNVNNLGNWLMSPVEKGPHFYQGQQLVVDQNWIQVDGGRVYLIIGPSYSGYYVDASKVKFPFE